jgi:hypothetical protein
MYQQTLSNCYEVNAGQEFTEARVQNLIHKLQKVTPARVQEHRTWLRHNMHKWWQDRWVAPTPVYLQGVVHQCRTPEETSRTIEESEQVLEQTGPSMHMAETSPHRMEYQQQGKLLKPEEEPHRTGAHNTQLIDLTTEETAASAELANSIQTRKIYPSHTMRMGVGRAARHFTERVELQAKDEGKEIPLRA